MKLLIACEMSGAVRDAMRAKGHDAYSCDLLPNPSPYHIQGDAVEQLHHHWDGLIAFPPCTDLCVSGARWFPAKRADGRQQASIKLFMHFANSTLPHAIENPVGIMSTVYRKPDQIIQPWMFGHGETKATCLWLNKLPKLVPTNIVEGRSNRIHMLPPSKDRAMIRSLTYPGIALAMAGQWFRP